MTSKLNAGAQPGSREGVWASREPWPWLLMLGPVVVIVAGFVTAYLAVVSNDGLVEDDYYKQGLAVNQRTARAQRAAELGIEVELLLGGTGDRVRALLRGKEGFHLPEVLNLRIVHPRSEGGGVYTGALAPLQGRWHVTLEDDRQEWRLAGDWLTESQATLRLTASARAGAVLQTDSDGR